MVAETSVKSNNHDAPGPLAVARGTGETLADALTLAELQLQLAEIDLRDAWRRLTGGVMFLVMGATLGLSTLPPAIAAIALAISANSKLELWVSLAITVGATLVIAGSLAAWGYRKIQRRGALFARSREELLHNSKWFKSMLKQSRTDFRRAAGS